MREATGKRGSPKLWTRVPAALHRAVKLLSALEGRPAAEIVHDALLAYVPEKVQRDAAKALKDAG